MLEPKELDKPVGRPSINSQRLLIYPAPLLYASFLPLILSCMTMSVFSSAVVKENQVYSRGMCACACVCVCVCVCKELTKSCVSGGIYGQKTQAG